jgi:hypothetical protein
VVGAHGCQGCAPAHGTRGLVGARPYLDHADLFARNGAAEVLQNIGILDSLIVLEAATARPSASKVEMLRKIAAAGGSRMTDALLDRVGEHQRPRVRELLTSIGLEPAGVQA